MTMPHEKYGHPSSPGLTGPTVSGATNDVELNEINTYGHVLTDEERDAKVRRGREATEAPAEDSKPLTVKKTAPAKSTGAKA